MKLTKIFVFLAAVAVFTACQKQPTQMNPGGYTGENKDISKNDIHPTQEAEHSTGEAHLSEVARPQKIADMMTARGNQDKAFPVLKFIEPINGATAGSSTVKVKLEIGGELMGYKPMKDPETGMGNHILVILDNQPYEAYYNLDQEFELKNVSDGEHTLRVFPSRPWHESYKNAGAFQIVEFTVKNGGADTSKPAKTNSNQAMSNAAPEGKEMKESTSGAVDAGKPLLTYSRPKGDYKGADAEAIMIDFWLSNAKLVGDGGEYRVRYSVDGGEAKYIDKWSPIWLKGFADGKHSVKLELVDKSGTVIENGGYNSTTREITVAK